MELSLGNWISLGTAAAAGIAFIAGLIQYRHTQRWKRAEFVAKEIKEFKNDPAVHNAMLMLDWNEHSIELFPGDPDLAKRSVLVNDELLCRALAPVPDKSAARLPDDCNAIRAAFDKLFDALERFEYFIQAGLVSRKEFDPYLHYWVEIIGNRKSLRKDLKVLNNLWEYIDSYYYSGVQRLLRRYGYNIRPARKVI